MNRIVPVLVGLAFIGFAGYVAYNQVQYVGFAAMWSQPVVWASGFFAFLGLITIVRTVYRSVSGPSTETPPADPEAPWTVREAWRTDVLAAKSTIQKSLLFFAVLWNAISWPVAYFVMSGTIEGEGEPWIVVLFPLIGLGLIGAVVWQVVKARKYGTTRLKMDTMPGRLGQVLDAVVRTDIDASDRPDNDFEVSLACYWRYVTYTRDSDGDTQKKVRRDLKWRDEKTIRPRVGANNKLEIPVSFPVPSDAPASALHETEERMLWELKATADVPGIDYEATFEIPVLEPEGGVASEGAGAPDEAETSAPEADEEVFWTVGDEEAGPVHAESSGDDADEGAYADYDTSDDFTEPVSDGIRMRRTGSGVEFEFEAGRNKTGVIVMAIIGLIFVGIGGLFFVNGSWFWGLLFIGAAGAGGYAALYSQTFASSVAVANGSVTVVTGAFGKQNRRSFPAAHLADVQVNVSGQSGDNYAYALVLHPVDEDAIPELKRRKETQESISTFLKGAGVSLDETESATKSTQGGETLDEKSLPALLQKHSKGIRVADGLYNKAEADWIADQLLAAAERESRF